MENNLTIDEITKELIDGLEMDFEDTKTKLLTFMKGREISLDTLRDLCWANSADIFDMIA